MNNGYNPRIFARDLALHGSAQWATRDHLRARQYGERGRIFLGYGLPENNKARAFPITTNTHRHLITIAPTRSGKAVSTCVPRCLEHQGPLVVTDVKDGELAIISAQYRRDVLGHKVIIIDPWNIACQHLDINPSCYNALDWLDPTNDDFIEDAMLIADSLVIDRGSKEPFWNDEARALLMGLIMYVAASPTIFMPTENKSRDLGQVRRLLNLPPQEFKEMVEGKFEGEGEHRALIQPGMAQSPYEAVRAACARILNKSEREFSSVLSTALQHTHFLESPRIQKSLSRSDFNIDDLQNGDMDIFIVLPAGRLLTYNRFLRKLLNIFITAVTRFKIKPNPPVYFLLEEAAALGRLDVIENAYGLMAGFGMQLHMIVQDLNQLNSIYGDRWQTFIANSGVIQCFGTRDVMGAEYLSRLSGMSTVESLSEESSARRAGLISDPHFLSREDGIHGRALITPDEIMTMHPAAQLLILAHCHPVTCFKTAYFLDKNYRDINSKPYFNIHPHYQDRPLPRAIDFTRAGLDIGAVLNSVMNSG